MCSWEKHRIRTPRKISCPGSFRDRAANQDNDFHKFCSKNLISEIFQLEQSAKYLM